MKTMKLSCYLWSLLTHLSFIFELIAWNQNTQGTVPIPTRPICTENLFMCQEDKVCIPSGWVCDYSYDCVDKSDELGCHSETTTILTRADCKESEFTCQQDNYCIPMEWVCDKAIDCIDNSDEMNCTATQCEQDEVRCRSSGHCIKGEWICDGESDCIDNSDEENCPLKSTTTESSQNLMTTEMTDPIDLASFIQSHNIKMFFPINESSQKNYPGKQIHSVYFETSTKEAINKSATDLFEEHLYTTLIPSSIESEAEEIFVNDEMVSYNVPIFFTFADATFKIDENATYSVASRDNMSDPHSEVSSVTTDTTISSTLVPNTNETEFLSANLLSLNFTNEDPTESTSGSGTDTHSTLTTTDRFLTDFSTTMPIITPIQTTTLHPASTSSPSESISIHTIATTTFTPTTTTPLTTTTTTTNSPSTTTTTHPTTTTPTRATTPYPCRGEEFFCSVDRTCIPVEWRCDLTPDCWDGSDERNCDLVRCPHYMLQCEVSGQCIFPAWICDGAKDCEDGSDERGC